MTVDMNVGYTQAIIRIGIASGVLRNQMAYFLATSAWETAYTMVPVEEAYYLGDDADAYRQTLYYYPWYGRGFVQLTHEDNYDRADDELSLEGAMLQDPDLALNPQYAVHIMFAGMFGGWFTGKKLQDYVDIDHSDYVGARGVINGTDHATDIAALACEYEDVLLADGYGVDDDTPDTPDVKPDMPIPDKYAARLLIGMAQTLAKQDARISALEAFASSYKAPI